MLLLGTGGSAWTISYLWCKCRGQAASLGYAVSLRDGQQDVTFVKIVFLRVSKSLTFKYLFRDPTRLSGSCQIILLLVKLWHMSTCFYSTLEAFRCICVYTSTGVFTRAHRGIMLSLEHRIMLLFLLNDGWSQTGCISALHIAAYCILQFIIHPNHHIYPEPCDPSFQ